MSQKEDFREQIITRCVDNRIEKKRKEDECNLWDDICTNKIEISNVSEAGKTNIFHSSSVAIQGRSSQFECDWFSDSADLLIELRWWSATFLSTEEDFLDTDCSAFRRYSYDRWGGGEFGIFHTRMYSVFVGKIQIFRQFNSQQIKNFIESFSNYHCQCNIWRGKLSCSRQTSLSQWSKLSLLRFLWYEEHLLGWTYCTRAFEIRRWGCFT